MDKSEDKSTNLPQFTQANQDWLNPQKSQKFGLHLFCFISNAVKKQPVDIFENFVGVA